MFLNFENPLHVLVPGQRVPRREYQGAPGPAGGAAEGARACRGGRGPARHPHHVRVPIRHQGKTGLPWRQ